MSSLSQVNADVLKQAQQRIQQDLLTTLAAFSIPEPLKSAVHHAVMLGGKRVRPLCVTLQLLYKIIQILRLLAVLRLLLNSSIVIP